LQNGTIGGTNRVTGVSVTLAGVVLATPRTFNLTTATLDIPLNLSTSNSLSVRVIGQPGSFLTITILAKPIITTLLPTSAAAGATININGNYFDDSGPSQNLVRFAKTGGGETTAVVTTATATQLSVVVPNDVATGTVSVQTAGGTATGPTFTLLSGSNQPPTVDAGQAITITLPNTANLSGTASDDGQPSNTLTVSWSAITPPATVIFGSANALATTAIFSTPGVYTLRLTANDSQLTSSGDVVVTVNSDPTPPPPDPMLVAPPLDMTVATTIGKATEFLYEGANPIQTGVAPGTIEPERVAVLRGRVLNKANAPLPLVKITVLDHPEFGETRSRADGRFDMAVNGGGVLTVKYEKVGFLPVQRTEDVPWQAYEGVPDVVMVMYDPAVTLIDLTDITPIQVAQGTTSTDTSGTRRATLLFKQGTTATMKLPGGTMQVLDKLHVRVTEFTVGANGVNAMPGDLPPTSAYTYAVANSVDEAVAAGALEVTFSQPVVQYLENFLTFPVGTSIPLGSYDTERVAWVSLSNGRVVKILTITGGIANLALTGSGQLATDSEYAELGINVAERQALATLYSANQSLWRLSLPHFTSKDANWPGSGNAGQQAASPNGGTSSSSGNPPNNLNLSCGSVIGCQSQTLGESIKLVGVPFTLNYASDRTPGRQTEYTINIPLSGASVPSFLQRIDLEVSVAGQLFRQSFPGAPNQATTYTWDGKDAYGRILQGKQPAIVTIGFVYPGVYYDTVGFGYTSNGIPLLSNATRREVTFLRDTTVSVGAFDARGQGLGGWSLDVQHVYDPIGRTLYTGDGGRRRVESVNRVITTAAGTGAPGYSGDGGQATAANFNVPEGLDFAPDGSVYIADNGNRVVRHVGTNGIVTRVVGTVGLLCIPATDPCGDGGQASAARLSAPVSVAFAPDGSYYVLDPGANKVRKVATNGVISTVVGTGTVCPLSTDACGDGGPATQAKINNSQGIFVAPDGTLFLADSSNRRIRRIGTDGIISTIAGNGNAGGCPVDNVPATQACLGTVFGVVLAPDGALYFAESQFHRIFKMGVDGILHVIAGNGTCGSGGDGGPATAAQLCNPEGIDRGPDGSIYIADWANGRIRQIGSDGIINTIAGNGVVGYSGDGGAATVAMIRQSSEVKVAPDGTIWIADLNNHRIRRLLPPLPGFTNTDIAIPSTDGSELYQFDPAGRHLRTVNTLTGANRYAFIYDGAGRLTAVVDGDFNVTNIQRDGAGNPTGILTPDNHLTTLVLNAGGYINKITDPASQMAKFVYSASGLMTQYTTPRNDVFAYTYDSAGRLTRDDDPAGGFQTLARTGQDSNYNVLLTTALNRTNNYQVQELANGDQQRVNTLPNSLQRSLLERPNGTTKTNTSDGMVTNDTLGPDPRWKMQAPLTSLSNTTIPGALTLSTTFSRAVTLANPIDPLSLVTLNDSFSINGRNFTSNFTAATQTFVDTTPVGRQTTTMIDAQGRTTQQQIANLDPASFGYDTRGRLSTAAFGSGANERTFSLAYNADGFLSSLTDALNRVTSLAYDAAGRVTQQTLPDTRVIGFGYDANGNVTSITPPGRPAHTFGYNALDLLTSYTPPAIVGTGPTQFAYNLDRQLTTITRPDALTLTYAYDAAGRLQTLTTPNGAYGYTFNATTGNPSGITAPGGGSLSFAYDGPLRISTTWAGIVAGSVSRTFDNNLRVTSQSVNGSGIPFTYDDDSLLVFVGSLGIDRNAQNGLITGTTLAGVTDTRGYNGLGELTSYAASFNATPFYGTAYTRDKLGRITQKVETVEGVTDTYDYTYDLAGRLRTVDLNNVTVATYDYDSNSNRAKRTTPGGTINGTYDDQDRMTTYGATTYVYTANGELASKSVSLQTTNYSYDVVGNLRNVTLPGGIQIEYVIDGQNRRIGKKVNGTLTQGFLYQSQLAPIAELDGDNNVVSRFIYGSGGNAPDYMTRGGVPYRLIKDHLGSVRFVVDSTTGDIEQSLDYDEFGAVLIDTNPGFQPFGFAGGLYDAQTGLLRFGARDYDPQTGRWTVKDPILFQGGDPNLYGYVVNDPINFVDPSGEVVNNYDEVGLKVDLDITNAELKKLKEEIGKACPTAAQRKRLEELQADLEEIDRRMKLLKTPPRQKPPEPQWQPPRLDGVNIFEQFRIVNEFLSKVRW
jgi:RHS repeat-associated protein